MKRILLISAILALNITGAHAGINPFKPYKPLSEIDYAKNISLSKDPGSIAYKPNSFTSRTLMPMGMLATSFLINDNYLDKRIVKQGSITSPTMYNAADYIQYSPAVIMLSLKAAGMEGRSDWARMLTADGTAIALQTAVTHIIKNTVKRERPDGRARNSYPSGHSATSFMCAHMLYKEYGQTGHEWIGLAGYGLAGTTALFRVIANRHWCSDVLGGAAIGIVSTELAYELTDILFGDNRLRKPIVVNDIDDMPTWRFGLYSDYSLGSDVFCSGGYGNPNARPATSIGFDASYMPWYIGAVIRVGLTQMKWTGEQDIFLPPAGSVADVYTVGAGFGFDIPVVNRVTFNGQFIAGYSPTTNSYSFLDAQNQPVEWKIPDGQHCYGNLGMTVRTSQSSSVSAHCGLDYYDKVWRSLVLGARFNYTF